MNNKSSFFTGFLSSNGFSIDKVKASPNFWNIALPFLSMPSLKKNEEGKYLFSSYVEGFLELGNIATNKHGDSINKDILGHLLTLLDNNRGEIVHSSQTKNPRLSAATPLVLYSYKENYGINYEDWDWKTTHSAMYPMLGPLLIKMLPYFHTGLMTQFDLPTIREQAKVGRSGKNLPTTGIYIGSSQVEDEAFKSLPVEVRKLLVQFWVWDPSIRHPAMICDLDNLDNMPAPLAASTIPELVEDLPWKVSR